MNRRADRQGRSTRPVHSGPTSRSADPIRAGGRSAGCRHCVVILVCCVFGRCLTVRLRGGRMVMSTVGWCAAGLAADAAGGATDCSVQRGSLFAASARRRESAQGLVGSPGCDVQLRGVGAAAVRAVPRARRRRQHVRRPPLARPGELDLVGLHAELAAVYSPFRATGAGTLATSEQRQREPARLTPKCSARSWVELLRDTRNLQHVPNEGAPTGSWPASDRHRRLVRARLAESAHPDQGGGGPTRLHIVHVAIRNHSRIIAAPLGSRAVR